MVNSYTNSAKQIMSFFEPMSNNKIQIIFILFLSTLLLVFFWSDVELSHDTKLNVVNKVCNVNYIDQRPIFKGNNDLKLKTIYFITPTYPRPEQTPELLRLSHTLMHVPKIHWIVADDQPTCSQQVLKILRNSGLPYTHLSSPKPYKYTTTNFPRGVSNRRAALNWLQSHVKEGILYFGDDDNTIDLQLFDDIRLTKKVSMFPVGLIGAYGVSSPIVVNGKVEGFFDSWHGKRTFPVDMAGFAVNIEYLKPSVTMPYITGQEEDKFLVSIGLKMEDIEPLADNCTKIFVWHTKTKKFKKNTLHINVGKLSKRYSNLANLLEEMYNLDVANMDPANGYNTLIIRDNKMIPVQSLY